MSRFRFSWLLYMGAGGSEGLTLSQALTEQEQTSEVLETSEVQGRMPKICIIFPRQI